MPDSDSGRVATGPSKAIRPRSPMCPLSLNCDFAPRAFDRSLAMKSTSRIASLTAGVGTRSSKSMAPCSVKALVAANVHSAPEVVTPLACPGFRTRANSSEPSRSRTIRSDGLRLFSSPNVTLRARTSTSMPVAVRVGTRHSGLRLPGNASDSSEIVPTPSLSVRLPPASTLKRAARSSEPFCTSTSSASP